MNPTTANHARLLALVSACLLSGCSLDESTSLEPDESLNEAEEEVVGGVAEAGYLSAGYLVRGPVGGNPTGRVCTAVQVGPNLVLTGAHCFYNWTPNPPTLITNSFSWGFGRGPVANGEIYTATSVTLHGSYNPTGSSRFLNDLALVTFTRAIGGGTWSEVVAPVLGANCGTATAVNRHTYVGYGRDTPGGIDAGANVPGDRRSATQCIATNNTLDLRVAGGNGGLCWGDSGGPLFETGTSRVAGVLSDFDIVFNCQVGNNMIFTRLSAYRNFICGATTYVGNGAFCGRSLAAELTAAQIAL
jgi:secreted trypsin-like serine protease